MSAVATKTKPELGHYEKTSLSYIQRIISSSVAQIFKVRGYFSSIPEGDEIFDVRKFGPDLKVHIFKKEAISMYEEVKEVVELIRDVMDAVEKRYLNQLILSFYESSPNDPLENYSFIFGYEKDDLELSFSSFQEEETASQTSNQSSKQILLSATTSVFLTLQNVLEKSTRMMNFLPPRTKWTYTLKYYPHTPKDYHIPNDGFYRVQESIPESFFQLGYEERSVVMNTANTQMGIKIKTKYDMDKRNNGTVITGDLDVSLNIPSSQSSITNY